MDTLENSPQQWNRFWSNGVINFYSHLPLSCKLDNFIRRQIHFKAINKLLNQVSFAGKDILELGSGTGSNSLYLTRSHKVNSVTLLDFSEKALARVKERFYPCEVIKIQEDLLCFSPKKDYDFVHSTGLVEHFFGEERLLVIKKHVQCTRPGGLIMIWVPIFSPAFKLIRKINFLFGIKEIPLTKSELHFLCKENNLEIIREGRAFFGALYGILAKKLN